MGRNLGISERTVEQYLASAVSKLGANNRPHAVYLAIKYGIINGVSLSHRKSSECQ